MRCGTRLIQAGDTVAELLEHCGRPSAGNPERRLGTIDWLYSGGSTGFARRIVIRDGTIERIEKLEQDASGRH